MSQINEVLIEMGLEAPVFDAADVAWGTSGPITACYALNYTTNGWSIMDDSLELIDFSVEIAAPPAPEPSNYHEYLHGYDSRYFGQLPQPLTYLEKTLQSLSLF